MKLTSIIFSGILGMCISTPLQAQNKPQAKTEYCEEYHIKNCKFQRKDLEFKYNSQSRSALFRPGQACTFTISVFKGYDYRMTFKADDNLLQGKPIMYKVIDTRTKKVLYQSTEQDWNTDFEFVCDNSLNLEIRLQLPDVPYEPNEKVLYGCMGFLLESRNSLKTGF
jgi:hypothetical protein